MSVPARTAGTAGNAVERAWCPICCRDDGYENLSDGTRVCNGCGYAIRYVDDRAVVQPTSKSFTRSPLPRMPLNPPRLKGTK